MSLPVIGIVGIPGSDLLPTTDTTGLILASIFAGCMALGLGWLVLQRTRRPKLIAQMKRAVQPKSDTRSDVDIYLPSTFDSKVSP